MLPWTFLDTFYSCVPSPRLCVQVLLHVTFSRHMEALQVSLGQEDGTMLQQVGVQAQHPHLPALPPAPCPLACVHSV